jgi:hypothetical protein
VMGGGDTRTMELDEGEEGEREREVEEQER